MATEVLKVDESQNIEQVMKLHGVTCPSSAERVKTHHILISKNL